MTFEQLLEKSSKELELMTDQELLVYLGPCLKDCPPIELSLIKAKEDQEKLIKDTKKLQLKNEKQLAKFASKDPLQMLKQLDELMKQHSQMI